MINEEDAETKLEAMARSRDNLRTLKAENKILLTQHVQASTESVLVSIDLDGAHKKIQVLTKRYERILKTHNEPLTESYQELLTFYTKKIQESKKQAANLQQIDKVCSQKIDELNIALDVSMAKTAEAEITYHTLAEEVVNVLGRDSHHAAELGSTDAL